MSAKNAKVLADKVRKDQESASADREEKYKEHMVNYKKKLKKDLPKTLCKIESEIKAAIDKNNKYIIFYCDETDEYALCEAEVVMEALDKRGYTTKLDSFTQTRDLSTEGQPTTYSIKISW